ncbi:MAG: peptidoglycan editing factor PgeF [Bacteroidales bacterium]
MNYPFPEVYCFDLLRSFPDLSHFVTMRGSSVSDDPYSSFNICDYTGDDLKRIQANRIRLAAGLGIRTEEIIVPRQVHGDEIAVIRFAGETPEADAVVTDLPEICLTVSTADCVPVLLYCPHRKVIAAVHAGWRGTVKRIAAKTVRFMCEHYGCVPGEIVAAIGPSISAEIYEVGDEVAEVFRACGFAGCVLPSPKEGKAHIDLWRANREDLLAAGLLPEHIETAGICTYREHERFFSARRLGIRSGRISSGIMLRKG